MVRSRTDGKQFERSYADDVRPLGLNTEEGDPEGLEACEEERWLRYAPSLCV